MKLSPLLKKPLIGFILGDLYASRSKAPYNKDYLNYLYSLFEPTPLRRTYAPRG
jgi:hypothetical protein